MGRGCQISMLVTSNVPVSDRHQFHHGLVSLKRTVNPAGLDVCQPLGESGIDDAVLFRCILVVQRPVWEVVGIISKADESPPLYPSNGERQLSGDSVDFARDRAGVLHRTAIFGWVPKNTCAFIRLNVRSSCSQRTCV
jgi:hypothetical protein